MKFPALTLALALTGAAASAITIPVAEDTFSNAKNAISLTSGKATSLAVTSKNRAFISFDLSTLPAGLPAEAIGQARLHIFTNRVLKPGMLEVRFVTSSWSENAEPGTTAPTIDEDPTPLATLEVPLGKHFLAVDVTEAVKAWITDPTTNFGLAFVSKDAAGKFYLGSKEGSGTGQYAFLEVDLNLLPDGLVDNNGHLDGALIKSGSVGNTQLATGAVLSGNLGTNAVTTDSLGSEVVTLAKLDNNSVDSSKIVDSSIGTDDLADGAVTTPKIAALAVTTAKLDDGAVTADKIAAGAITPDKLSSPQVLVKVQKTTTLTLPANNETAVANWSSVFDTTTPSFNTSTGVFTAPVAGKYKVSWLALISQSALSQGDVVELRAGGETIAGNTFDIVLLTASSQYLSGSNVYSLSAGGTLQFSIFTTHGSTIAAGNGGANHLTIERIGD